MTETLSPPRRLARVCALAFCALLASPALAQNAVPPGAESVPFLTLRNQTGSASPASAFGGRRAGLSAGYCILTEPSGFFTPLAEATALKMPGRDFTLSALHLHDPATVFDDLQETAAGNRAALYVHGYYEGIERNCVRAGMLRRNIGLEGRLLMFSWPSDEDILRYASDEADLFWSVPGIADATRELVRRFGPGQVDLIGHSLGGRGVVLALDELARGRTGSEPLVDDVVLIAPDMDFDVFVQHLARIRPVARTITIYVSNKDLPLAISAELHGYPRLGETGNDTALLDGVEVIDVSAMSGIGAIDIPGAPASSLSGHVYHLSSRDITADMATLLNEGKRAADRPALTPAGPNLWRLNATAR